MHQFYSLEISRIESDRGALVWTLAVPEDLREIFAFEPGQHLTFRAQHNGEELRRNYSICSSRGELKVLIKSVPEGRFSTQVAAGLKPGDAIEVMPPSGHFTLQPEAGATYVAFAAGSGITPVMGMLHAVLESNASARFILFYGNRSSADVLLQDDLMALKDRHGTRLAVHVFFSRQQTDVPLYAGRLDEDKVSFLFNNVLKDIDVKGYYVCGPGQMIDRVCDRLAQLGVPDARIHNERFLSDGEAIRPQQKTARLDAGVTVTLDGVISRYTIRAGEQMTLLESAQKAGIDLPYACKAGVCATCRCRLLQGEVNMLNNYSLEQWELDAGYVLACQAVPESESLHLSFDE